MKAKGLLAALVIAASLGVLALQLAPERGPTGALPPTAPSPSVPIATAPGEPPAPALSPPGDTDPERALLQSAEAILDKQPTQALKLLAEGDAKFPAGPLADERQFLKLRARVNLDQIAEARVDATRYLELNPKSPLAPRIHRLLGIRPPPELAPTP